MGYFCTGGQGGTFEAGTEGSVRRWEERSRQREHRRVCRDEGGRVIGNEVSKGQGGRWGCRALHSQGRLGFLLCLRREASLLEGTSGCWVGDRLAGK